jgi:hypothetical protein
MNILSILGIFFLGGFLAYFLFTPHRKDILISNKEIEAQEQEYLKITETIAAANKDLEQHRIHVQNFESQIIECQAMYASKIKDKEALIASLDSRLCQEKERFETAKKDYEKEYLAVMQSRVDSYQEAMKKMGESAEKTTKSINDLKSVMQAAIDANKKALEEKINIDFYKVILPQSDLDDIKKIKSIKYQLNNQEIMNKLIWKTYFEKPTNEMIGRVVGNGIVTGIYKITDQTTQKVYIGQSVDISTRIKQHIKRGLGAETPLKNKLYPAMDEIGVENFTFEIVEQCSRNMLNEKEKFWIDYFDSKNFGFNVTAGGS